jgi:WD40 repeat protein
MSFSPDGTLLAVAGDFGFMASYILTVSVEPLQRHNAWLGHNATVIDLSWSSSSTHLLSASMDRNVILWGIDQESPLLTFPHPDIVSSVKFHPLNANFFLSGSFDRNVRVWSIPNARVEVFVQALDLVTCVNYSSSGNYAFVGLLRGRVVVYNCPAITQLKFVTQLSCRNRKGLKKFGKKVTGLELMDDSHLLVTTNDSRLRLFNLHDFSMKQKYKGHTNENGPIKATFSHNLLHVVCSSDTGEVYIWNAFESQAPQFKAKRRIFKRDRNTAYEYLRVCKNKVATCAQFAPGSFVRSIQEYLAMEGKVVSHVLITADNDCCLKVYFNTFSST